MRPSLRLLLCFTLAATGAVSLHAADADALIRDALAAEAKFDTRRALDLFLEAEKTRPKDAFLLQKIARQYSDIVVDLKTEAEKKASVLKALDYAERSVALDPKNAVNVLSLAVCHGKLAVYGDIRTKVEMSRKVKDEAVQALALDPNYAWAHHLLGRWHYEINDLGGTAKFFVRLFYGGLPDASNADAIKHLAKAVELEPEELEHHLELGFAYAADKQVEKARAAFKKGLAMPSRAKHDDAAKERARPALAKLG